MKNVLKRIGLLSLTLLMLVSMMMLAACDGGDSTTATKPAPPSSPTGTTSGNGGNGGDPTPKKPTYTIKVIDEAGNPVQGVRVQFCVNESCTPMMAFPSNAEGIITITHMEAAEYAVKLLSVPSGFAEDTTPRAFNSENHLEIVLIAAQ